MAMDIESMSISDLIDLVTDVDQPEGKDNMLLHMEISDRIKNNSTK
jgi:hypothetical protein